MIPLHSASLAGIALLAVGCASPWPNLPSREYTGVVINVSLNAPEPGATVSATRPGQRGIALIPKMDDLLGSTTTDLNGRFRLRTKTGYATQLAAVSADERLSGICRVALDEKSDLRLKIEPCLSEIAVQSPVDPGSRTVEVAEKAIYSIICYVSAHPKEHLGSLQRYSALGVISPEAMSNFTEHPDVFFGSQSAVKYRWGRDVLHIPDAHTSITLRPASLPGS